MRVPPSSAEAIQGTSSSSGQVTARLAGGQWKSLWLPCALMVVAFWLYHLWVSALMQAGHLRLGAVSYKVAPFYAYLDPRCKSGLLPALAVLAGYGLFLRKLLRGGPEHEARKVGWLMLWMPLIAVAVCGIDGNLGRLARPFERLDLEYYGAVARVDHVGQFIGTYPLRAHLMPMHAQTHPPGAILFLWVGTWVVGSSPWGAAMWAIAFSALSVPAVYLWGNELGGRQIARLGAGLYVLMPNVAMFTATSMDGPFAVFLIWSMYLGWRAVWNRSPAVGMAAGLVLALATLMTFSASVAGLFILVAAVVRELAEPRRTGLMRCASWYGAALTLSGVALGGLAVYVPLYVVTGYHPADMLGAAMSISAELMGGTGHVAWWQHWHIAAANLVVFFFCCGVPVTVLWLRGLRGICGPPRAAGAMGAAVAAFVVTLLTVDVFPLYSLETERIWIFLAPLVAIPAASRWLQDQSGRSDAPGMGTLVLLLAAQTVATEVLLGTYW